MGNEIRGEIGPARPRINEGSTQAAWCTSFSRSQHLLSQSTNSQSLTEPGGSAPFAQKVAIESNPEPGEQTPHHPLTDCISFRSQLHLHIECLDFPTKLKCF